MFVVPSRSRPNNVHRLARAAPDVPFILMLDDDDPMLEAYDGLPINFRVLVSPRAALSELYNRAYAQCPNCAWYGIFADDVVPETPDWSSKLIDAAGDDGMAYGNDGIGQPTHFVLGAGFVKQQGWLAYPGLQRLYIDTVWKDLAERAGVLRYLPEVRVTHMHPSVGKAMMDATYRKQGKGADKALYAAFKLQHERSR